MHSLTMVHTGYQHVKNYTLYSAQRLVFKGLIWKMEAAKPVSITTGHLKMKGESTAMSSDVEDALEKRQRPM